MMKRTTFFYFVVFLFWFGQYVYTPHLSPHMQIVGISATLIGAVSGVYGATQLILRVPVSIYGSTKGSHRTIIGMGLVGVCISCILPLFSHSWVMFFIMRALAGAASSTWVSFTAYVLEGAEKKSNSNMGLIMTCNMLGVGGSQLYATFTFEHIGMNGLFITGIIVAVIAVIFFLLIPFKKSGTIPGSGVKFEWKMFAVVLKSKHLWICTVLMALAYWIMFSTNWSFTGVYAQEVLGATSVQIGLLAFAAQAANASVAFIIGRLGGRRLPERALLTISFIGFGVYCIAQPFCPSTAILTCVQVLGGLSLSIPNVILFASQGRDFPPELQLLSMGFFQSLYSIGITVGPIVSGSITEHFGYFSMYMSLLVVAAVGVVVTLALYKDTGDEHNANSYKKPVDRSDG
jgi:MFS family permease